MHEIVNLSDLITGLQCGTGYVYIKNSLYYCCYKRLIDHLIFSVNHLSQVVREVINGHEIINMFYSSELFGSKSSILCFSYLTLRPREREREIQMKK